jgi:hypothetical protein
MESNERSRDRRRFLRKLAATSILGGFAGMLHQPSVSGAADAGIATGIYDVKAYGAVGDGVADDASGIQHAIQSASSSGGGLVWIPPGVYRLGSNGLRIPRQVIVAGTGWWDNGSWFYVDRESVSVVVVDPSARGSVIRDVAVKYDQPDHTSTGPWNPRDYVPAFDIQADDVYIHNVLLYNPTRGIYIHNERGSVGRVILDRIWGQPLLEGIAIDNALDAIKVNNVHFWPFWNNKTPVRDFVADNAEAVKSFRNDNPHFSNIFAFGYKFGFHFGMSRGDPTNHGITSKFRIANADLDFCRVGLQVDGPNTTGQVVNFTAQGDGTLSSPAGLRVEASGVRIQGSNLRVTDFAGNGIRAEGKGSVVFLENVWVETWNKSGRGFPGVEAFRGARIYLGRSRWFENGSGGSNTGANEGGMIILDK